MATQTRYHPGGYNANGPAKNRAEEYDGTSGTYTSWDTAGTQTSTRALTTAEANTLKLEGPPTALTPLDDLE